MELAFETRLNAAQLRRFIRRANVAARNGSARIRLDFGRVESAFPSAMVPLICACDALRREGIEVEIALPRNELPRRFFCEMDYPHLLAPDLYEHQGRTALRARRFTSSEEQHAVTSELVQMLLSTLVLQRDMIRGFEWCVNEITDNVLNHAQSPQGGVIQAVVVHSTKRVAFAVGDSGVGIRTSLREGIPDLQTDTDAIAQAVRAGVTRHPSKGQGNGLAGTLKISTATGGGFELTSGQGHMHVFSPHDQPDVSGQAGQNESVLSDREIREFFPGTLITAEIDTTVDLDIGAVLAFDGRRHVPVDLIELNYESDSGERFDLAMHGETVGFGSRASGMMLRTKCTNILACDRMKPIRIDWSGIPFISSSFADEFIGKLYVELGPLAFGARVQNVGMDSLVATLIDKAILQRLTQERDAQEEHDVSPEVFLETVPDESVLEGELSD